MKNDYEYEVQKNDFRAIQKSLERYLKHECSELEMIDNIDMLASSTFDNKGTKEFFENINRRMCDIEMKYFIIGEKPYDQDVIELVEDTYKKMKEYEIDMFK